MKKLILCVMLGLLFAGCTTKEQDQQIEAFWKRQAASLVAERLGMRQPETMSQPVPGMSPLGLPVELPMQPQTTPELAEGVTAQLPVGALTLVQESVEITPIQKEAQPTSAQEVTQPVEVTAEQAAPPTTQAEQSPVAQHEETPAAQNPQPVVQPAPAAQEQTAASTPATKTQTPAPEKLKAFLFVHSSSPLCQRMKQDNWEQNFRQKYQDKITLVVYDMANPASKEPLRHLMRAYKMPSLTVPVLFIGKSVVPGYPFEKLDAAVRLALSPATNRRTARKPKKQAQFMEIVMEDTPVTATNTKASARDRRAIQLAIAGVEHSNQATLNDISVMFDGNTQAEAFAIVSRTERLLKTKAATSPDYQTYLATQRNLLSLQEKSLNELMRKNARNIRTIRG